MIIPMSHSHLKQVMDIELRAYPWPWTEGMFLDSLLQQHICRVAIGSNQSVVGYLVAYIAVGECHILNVCVEPKQQRQGIGRQLMMDVKLLADEKQAEATFLEVRPSNQIAIDLYETLGFVQVGRRKEYYPAGDYREDGLVYCKNSLINP